MTAPASPPGASAGAAAGAKDAPDPSASGRVPPQLLLVVSRALQALATPIIALLITTAAGLGAEAEDAISFCNVLFVGNLCASGVVLLRFGWRDTVGRLLELRPLQHAELLLLGASSALLSALIFDALATTTVTNSVLLARLGPVFYALGSALLLGNALRSGEWIGFGLVVVGVLAVVFASGMLLVGDLEILASALVFAFVQLLSRRLIPTLGLPAMILSRNLISAVVFFCIALVLFGPGHFGDAFYGPLWGIMLVYSAVVVIAAQFAWYGALGRMEPAAVARWTVLSPVLAIGYAYAINGEVPSPGHVAALAFVSAGILASTLRAPRPMPVSDTPEQGVAAAG